MTEKETANPQVHGLEKEASKLQSDLANLMNQLKILGKGGSEATDEKVKAITEQLDFLKKNLGQISDQSGELLKQLDKSVRSNPYPYILGAATLGLLLGKVLRS